MAASCVVTLLGRHPSEDVRACRHETSQFSVLGTTSMDLGYHRTWIWVTAKPGFGSPRRAWIWVTGVWATTKHGLGLLHNVELGYHKTCIWATTKHGSGWHVYTCVQVALYQSSSEYSGFSAFFPKHASGMIGPCFGCLSVVFLLCVLWAAFSCVQRAHIFLLLLM